MQLSWHAVLLQLYDLISLHKIKYESKGTDVHNPEARYAPASLPASLEVLSFLSMPPFNSESFLSETTVYTSRRLGNAPCLDHRKSSFKFFHYLQYPPWGCFVKRIIRYALSPVRLQYRGHELSYKGSQDIQQWLQINIICQSLKAQVSCYTILCVPWDKSVKLGEEQVSLVRELNIGCCREAEATSNLSAILTISCLITTYVIKRLGLALAEIDARGGWTNASKPATELKEEIKTQ